MTDYRHSERGSGGSVKPRVAGTKLALIIGVANTFCLDENLFWQ